MQVTPLSISDDIKTELANFLLAKFTAAVQARQMQVDSNFRRWVLNYQAKPKVAVRTTPFYNASNFVPQLIRMNTDIMHARMMGLLFAPKPFWKPRTFIGSEFYTDKHQRALANWFEAIAFNAAKLFEPIDLTLHTAIKCGTSLMKAPWIPSSYWVGGSDPSGNFSGKEIKKEGLQISSIDFDDFWPLPIAAQSLAECQILFHRVRLTKEDVEYRRANPSFGWNPDAADKLLTCIDQPSSSPAREAEAQAAGITLSTDNNRPFNVVEAWLEYPISSDKSKRYRIVVTFNPNGVGKDSILRGIYNYYEEGDQPFVDWRFTNRPGLFYGTGFAELLEQSQEEQSQIHNSRRDSNTIAGVPAWKKKRYANVPDPSAEWYPGKVFELDSMDDLEPLQFGGNYNAMIEEESFLLGIVDRYTGVNMPMQGQGAGTLGGKRGVYSAMGTLALISEGNDRIDLYLKRLRFPFHSLGSIIFKSYRQFRPSGPELEFMGEEGKLMRDIFSFREPTDLPYLFFDTGATDAGANKETDRSALLLMANTMASYYRQVTEAASIISQIPDPNHPMSKILLSVLDGAKDLADRLLASFDIADRNKLEVDVRSVLGGSPQQGAEAAEQRGMPEAQSPVSVGGLQELSQRLTVLQGAGAQGA